MVNKQSRSEIRVKKHRRLRHHLVGTAQRPRLSVFRSNNHIYAQIIDDTVGNTLVAASTMEKAIKDELQYTDNVAEESAAIQTILNRAARRIHWTNSYEFTADSVFS